MGAAPRVNFWGTNFQALFKFDKVLIDNFIFKLHHQVLGGHSDIGLAYYCYINRC